VLAFHLGFGVEIASIGPRVGDSAVEYSKNQLYLGRIGYLRSPTTEQLLDHQHRGVAEDFAVVLLAGPLAQARHGRFRIDWRAPSVGEIPFICKLAAFHALGHGTSANSHYFGYLRARAATWVEAYWPQITVVAEAMVRLGELSGEEVEELIRSRPIPLSTDAHGKVSA
jgi:hypothetical protein